MNHNEAINAVLLELSRLGCLAARREVGLFYDQRSIFALIRLVLSVRRIPSAAELARILSPHRIGVKGEPDTQGTTPFGKSIAVEVKTRGGRLDKPQRAWRDAFVALGGLYMVARPDTDPEWRATLAALVESANNRTTIP